MRAREGHEVRSARSCSSGGGAAIAALAVADAAAVFTDGQQIEREGLAQEASVLESSGSGQYTPGDMNIMLEGNARKAHTVCPSMAHSASCLGLAALAYDANDYEQGYLLVASAMI
eukprot:6463981-Amphidinium_carterae.3